MNLEQKKAPFGVRHCERHFLIHCCFRFGHVRTETIILLLLFRSAKRKLFGSENIALASPS